MPGVVTVISTSFDKLKRLVVKALYQGGLSQGKGDVRTPLETSPFGVDSNPTQGKKGIYTNTGVYGKNYIFGYLNTDRVAGVGETRLFCTDASGKFKFNVWLKADGTVLIGDSVVPAEYIDFGVKYNNLKLEYDKTKLYLTTLRTATQAVAVAVDGVVPGTSAAFISAMGVLAPGDFSSAKHDKIKYK